MNQTSHGSKFLKDGLSSTLQQTFPHILLKQIVFFLQSQGNIISDSLWSNHLCINSKGQHFSADPDLASLWGAQTKRKKELDVQGTIMFHGTQSNSTSVPTAYLCRCAVNPTAVVIVCDWWKEHAWKKKKKERLRGSVHFHETKMSDCDSDICSIWHRSLCRDCNKHN